MNLVSKRACDVFITNTFNQLIPYSSIPTIEMYDKAKLAGLLPEDDYKMTFVNAVLTRCDIIYLYDQYNNIEDSYFVLK